MTIKAGELVDDKEVNEDGTPIETDPEDGAPELDSEGNPIVDAGEGIGKDGEGGGGASGKGEEENPQITLLSEQNRQLQSRLDALEKGSRSSAPAAPAFTEEQWKAKEEELGMSRKAIEYFTNQHMITLDHIMAELDKRIAPLGRNMALSGLKSQKGFEDADKMQKHIDEFMSHFAPQQQSSENLLKKAYFYAKGMVASETKPTTGNNGAQKIRTTRPSSPSTATSGGNRTQAVKLTPVQEDALKKSGMTRDEYIKYLPKR